MKEDVIETVRALIALSASPNEHEARNAAYKACVIIRREKLIVGSKELPAKKKKVPQPNDFFFCNHCQETMPLEHRAVCPMWWTFRTRIMCFSEDVNCLRCYDDISLKIAYRIDYQQTDMICERCFVEVRR